MSSSHRWSLLLPPIGKSQKVPNPKCSQKGFPDGAPPGCYPLTPQSFRVVRLDVESTADGCFQFRQNDQAMASPHFVASPFLDSLLGASFTKGAPFWGFQKGTLLGHSFRAPFWAPRGARILRGPGCGVGAPKIGSGVKKSDIAQ